MQKICFIINPIAGKGKQKDIENQINKYLDLEKYSFEIKYTQRALHAIELSREASLHFDIVVAVGGDGTINEVSNGMVGAKSAMGIIPVGSGNGLSRHLGIPLRVIQAIQLLNKHKIIKIDSVKANDYHFVNVAGLGFDALIAHRFAEFGSRGFFPYIYITVKEFRKFKPFRIEIKANGTTYNKLAFLVSLANSAQFGNNAYIAPGALVDDGLISVVTMRKFPLFSAPGLALRLFGKSMHKSKYVETFAASELEIFHDGPILAHVDGEPVRFTNELHVKVLPSSINMVVPV